MTKETRTISSTGGAKGVKLARHDLVPTGPLTELAEHYGVGASKYANHQWRQGYEWSKSYSALMRHLLAFWSGLDYDVCSNDPDGCSHVDLEGKPFVAIREDACFNHTGSHHMAAVAWHAFLLLEFKDAHRGHDDRYVAPEPDSNVLETPEIGVLPLTEDFKQRMAPVGEDAGFPARWVREYDAEHGRMMESFPRVKVPGLTLRAEADFPQIEGLVDIQDAINQHVRQIIDAENRRIETRLREEWGPDLLRKHPPTRWERG